MPDVRTWSIDFDLREDASSVFVPEELLADARVGDVVVLNAGGSSRRHTGHVDDVVDDDTRGRYFVVGID